MEVNKKKIVIKLSRRSSSDSADDATVRKTRSMSRQAVENKSIDSNVQKKDQKEKSAEQLSDQFAIMKKFLDEKDDRKWTFFIDKLGKRDRKILRKLLVEDTSSENEGKKRKRPENSSNEDDSSKEGHQKKCKSAKQEPKKPPPTVKKENEEEKKEEPKNDFGKDEENVENGKGLDKFYYVMVNGQKTLVKVITEDVEVKDEDMSDSSIKEWKVPKTLKPFYSVSDSDEEKDRKSEKLRKVDGNGNGSSSSMGIEDLGDRISLAPPSSCPDILISDTTHDKTNDMSISDTLAEVFERCHADSNGNSNPNSDGQSKLYACTECMKVFMTRNGLSSHNESHHKWVKDKYCDLCPESFFSLDALKIHKVHAHKMKLDDNAVTHEILEIAGSIQERNVKVDLTVTDSESPVESTELQVVSSDEAPEQEGVVKTDESDIQILSSDESDGNKTKKPAQKTDETAGKVMFLKLL